MKNENTQEIEETTEATYCPEDNKLRLYCGRVDRPEFLRLRAEGWKSTPKQDCDFVTTWTVAREDSALVYGSGFIGDEDTSPAERAIDRAERFQGYQQKRFNEAMGHADQYDSKDSAHGHQNLARAESQAKKHDRLASKACDQWSKAEYWQSRTAGVISNALYKDLPGVRFGRIKTIETDLRRIESYSQPENYSRLINHLKNRLTYENLMLEAQGGRLEQKDMEIGGKLGENIIFKLNKSSATKRVTSCGCYGPEIVTGPDYYKRANIKGTAYSVRHIKTERLSPEAYTAPTPESLEELKVIKAEIKKAGAGKPKAAPLINPTEEEAQKLQDVWNACAVERYRNNYKKTDIPADLEQKVLFLNQAQYSANSQGSYARLSTEKVGTDLKRARYSKLKIEVAFKVRVGPSSSTVSFFAPDRVIVITDKPQKAFPMTIEAPQKAEEPKPEPTPAPVVADSALAQGELAL